MFRAKTIPQRYKFYFDDAALRIVGTTPYSSSFFDSSFRFSKHSINRTPAARNTRGFERMLIILSSLLSTSITQENVPT